MTIPTAVVFEQEWNVERGTLLVEATALTRARDALAAKRRRDDEYSPEALAGGRRT